MAEKRDPWQRRTLHVGNMNHPCCMSLLRLLLTRKGIRIEEIKPGSVTLSVRTQKTGWDEIENLLASHHFPILKNRETILVEEIKNALTDLVQVSTYNAMVRNSDYLVERFGLSYPYLSTLFSRHEGTTLEKFTIQLRIDKVKELIRAGDLTLSEIAYIMGYSSVQYLSTQFRSVTGMSVTEFKADPFQ